MSLSEFIEERRRHVGRMEERADWDAIEEEKYKRITERVKPIQADQPFIYQDLMMRLEAYRLFVKGEPRP